MGPPRFEGCRMDDHRTGTESTLCQGAVHPAADVASAISLVVQHGASTSSRGFRRGAATRCTLVITESLSLICKRPVLPDGFGVGGRRSAVPPRPPPLRVFAAALANARRSATPACSYSPVREPAVGLTHPDLGRRRNRREQRSLQRLDHCV